MILVSLWSKFSSRSLKLSGTLMETYHLMSRCAVWKLSHVIHMKIMPYFIRCRYNYIDKYQAKWWPLMTKMMTKMMTISSIKRNIYLSLCVIVGAIQFAIAKERSLCFSCIISQFVFFFFTLNQPFFWIYLRHHHNETNTDFNSTTLVFHWLEIFVFPVSHSRH